MKIQLKINGEWAVLPPGISLKMMKTSPLFSNQGDFSYPFELPVEPNRHIFGPISDPMGFVRLREFHALPAEIWFEGNQVFVGQTEVNGEFTLAPRGMVSFNVMSNNRSLKDMINGLKCRDVKLKRKLELGILPKKFKADWDTASWNHEWTTRFSKIDYDIVKDLPYISKIEEIEFYGETVLQATFDKNMLGEIEIPDGVVVCDPDKVNVDTPYPGMDYCNVSVCCKRGGDTSSGSTGNGYAVYKYDRLNWAPNFFVLYFIECLFDEKNLGISYNFDELLKEEDLTRLAFFNAAPRYDHDGRYDFISDYDIGQPIGDVDMRYEIIVDGKNIVDNTKKYFHKTLEVKASAMMKYPNLGRVNGVWVYDNSLSHNPLADIKQYEIYGGSAIANSDNFPDNTEVQHVFDDLMNAFGVFLDYDQSNNHVVFRLVREIMRETDVDEPLCTILSEPTITRNLNNGQRLKYSSSDEDVFDYKLKDDYVPEEIPFLDLVGWQLSKTDNRTKYDKATANFYRIKVNEDTGNEPQIFEVGGYNKYQIGVLMKDKEREVEEDGVSESTINFKPVTINDVWMWYVNRMKESAELWEYPDSVDDSMFAVWVDAESYYKIQSVDIFALSFSGGNVKLPISGNIQVAESKITTLDYKKRLQLHAPDGTPWIKASFYTIEGEATCVVRGDCAYDMSQDNNPLALANVGYQLGIMRGPGNKSGEELTYDYDDEGNDTWYSVPANPCFTADSVDNYGNMFDYNGEASEIDEVLSQENILKKLRAIFPDSNCDLCDEERLMYEGENGFQGLPYYFERALVGPVVKSVDGKFFMLSILEDGKKFYNKSDYTKIASKYCLIRSGDIKQRDAEGVNITSTFTTKNIYIGTFSSELEFYSYVQILYRLCDLYRNGGGNLNVRKDDLDTIMALFPWRKFFGNGGTDCKGRLSLKLDARKVKEYDDDGNPEYFEVLDNNVARRGLVPQLLEDFLYFKSHHIKITIPVQMSLSAINNLRLLKWNRFGDYVGLIKQVNYELTEIGLKNVTVELLVANK